MRSLMRIGLGGVLVGTVLCVTSMPVADWCGQESYPSVRQAVWAYQVCAHSTLPDPLRLVRVDHPDWSAGGYLRAVDACVKVKGSGWAVQECG
jgi:hypothetical protein